jgi:chromosome partitioning protein
MMHTLTVMNEKGGVGKTTLACTLAAGLAIKGCRVLLIDTDPQAHSTFFWGIQKQPGLFNLLVNGAEYRDSMIAISPEVFAPPETTSYGSLMIVPSNVHTRGIPAAFQNDYDFLDRALKPLADLFDYCVIDTAPTPSEMQVAILMVVDAILLPTQCEALSFDGLNETLSHIERANSNRAYRNKAPLKPTGIIPTMFRKSTVEHTENLATLHRVHGDLVYPPIHQRTNWTEAVNFHQPILAVAPTSRSAGDAWKVINRFMGDFHVVTA